MVNLNVRVLGNGAILCQYQEGGKAMDAGFMNWGEFIQWLKEKTND